MNISGLEQELSDVRKALAWMDLVLANLSEGVFVLNPDWKVAFTNDALSELVRSQRVYLLGQPVWQAVPLVRDGQTLEDIVGRDRPPLKDISSINGLYTLNVAKISRVVYLVAKYVDNLGQAVCVISDVTVEIQAQKRVKALTDQVALGEQQAQHVLRTNRSRLSLLGIIGGTALLALVGLLLADDD